MLKKISIISLCFLHLFTQAAWAVDVLSVGPVLPPLIPGIAFGPSVNAAAPSTPLPANPTETFGYDNNGNLIRKIETATGTVTDYIYDAENQLIQIKTSGVTIATYAYDGLGRRIEKSIVNGLSSMVFRYVYDNEDILLEYDGGSTGSPLNTLQARYTHGTGIDEPQ